MWNFRVGDLVAKHHPAITNPLQHGIVISANEFNFSIKWISFNKVFFMEKEEDIFRELNNSFLLNTVTISRYDMEHNLSLLNSSYSNVRETQKKAE
jgi:hypothetical protein